MSTELEPRLRAWLTTQAPADVPADLVARVSVIPGAARPWIGQRTWSFAPARRPATRLALLLATLLAVLLLAATSLFVGSQRPAPVPTLEAGYFEPAGSMATARGYGHTATLLPDGRVLVVGGSHAHELSDTAEIWDSATLAFSPAGSLQTPRSGHVATVLGDGRVLVVGGDLAETGGAEVWDDATMTFEPVILPDARSAGVAVALLRDARVLIVGGYDRPIFAATPQVVIWDPSTETSRTVGPSLPVRIGQSATSLPDGRVLVVGGTELTSQDNRKILTDAQFWDPALETFTPTGSLTTARSGHAAFLLSDGSVLIVGGDDSDDESMTAEIWDPTTETFSFAGSVAGTSIPSSLAPLPDGRFLVVGPEREVLAWDPRTGDVAPAGTRQGYMYSSVVYNSVAVPLQGGHVLVVGGEEDQPPPSVERGCEDSEGFTGWKCPVIDTALASAELWSPATS